MGLLDEAYAAGLARRTAPDVFAEAMILMPRAQCQCVPSPGGCDAPSFAIALHAMVSSEEGQSVGCPGATDDRSAGCRARACAELKVGVAHMM
jgi:hypothetical protein